MNKESDKCIHELFERYAVSTPGTIAIIYDKEKISYGELNRRANQLARYLIGQGVCPDDLVGLYIERSLDMVIALLAILKAGCAYVPINADCPTTRLNSILSDSGIKHVITQKSWRENIVENENLAICCMDNHLFINALDALDTNNISKDKLQITPNNLAYVIYTSGSTGQPKGVMITHAGVVNYLHHSQVYFSAGEMGGVVSSPLSFDATVTSLLVPLVLGKKIIIVPQSHQEIERLGEIIFSSQEPLLFKITPAHLDAISSYIDFDRNTPVAHRFVIGGEKFPALTARHWKTKLVPAGIFENEYGPTETVVGCSTYTIRTEKDLSNIGSSVPIGMPIVNTQFYVLDEQLNLLPNGDVGELYIGGKGVARGYLNQVGLTAEKFIKNPFSLDPNDKLYRTGDLVCVLPDGNFDFLGRIDHQVKIRGFRIELGDIESHLLSHSMVLGATVIAREDALGRQKLVAYVVADPGACKDTLLENFRDHLKLNLPEYMHPSNFVWMKKIPLTANGKINRDLLPEPDISDYMHLNYLKPETESEQILCKIWQDILGLARVGVGDNFYELGGDSILSIQIIARANKAGLRLSVQQLHENKTIKKLAQHVSLNDQIIIPPQENVQGNQILLPVQESFLNAENVDINHFNQSMLLLAPSDFSYEMLREIVIAFYERHDVFRLIFEKNNSLYSAYYRNGNNDHLVAKTLAYKDIGCVDSALQRQVLDEQCKMLQRDLSLLEGPLMRAALLVSGSSRWLFLTIHHLVVDGISWRILVNDLESAYRQLSAKKEPLCLGNKTSSYQQWGAFLADHAQNTDLNREYWLSVVNKNITCLPRDFLSNKNSKVATTQLVKLALPKNLTKLLIGGIHHVYQTQINDLLLSAVLIAINQWTNTNKLFVDLEGHGREDLGGDFDLSETVGWFTSVFPIALEVQDTKNIASVIKSVKEQLRAIPAKGIGCGLLHHLKKDAEFIAKAEMHQPEIVFNYLGQFGKVQETTETAFSIVEILAGGAGSVVSENRNRPYALGITAVLYSGELHFVLDYSSEVFYRETIERYGCAIINALGSIINHCRKVEKNVYTPSDFPLVTINQLQLDELGDEYPGMTNLYPSTAMQQGLLFHSLVDTSAYVTQYWFVFKGNLNSTYLRNACEIVLQRHDIFRTAFVGEYLHQVVVASINIPWRELDWRGKTDEAQSHLFDELRLTDKAQGYKIEQPGLIRLSLIRIADNRYQFLFSNHHALLDGWSFALVLDQIIQQYFVFVGTGDSKPNEIYSYNTYIEWLSKQDKNAAKAYWSNQLSDIVSPTIISIAKPESLLTQIPEIVTKKNLVKKVTLYIDNEKKLYLQRSMQAMHTTINTLIQSAWAYLLNCYANTPQVIFGVTQSGRTAQIFGIEDIVGLLINTVPIKVNFSSELHTNVCDWLRKQHNANVEREAFSYLPLIDILSGSSIEGCKSLFDSLLVFEADPVDISNILAKQKDSLYVENIDSDEQTNYGLTLVVQTEKNIKITLFYKTEKYSDESAKKIIDHFEEILFCFVTCQEKTINDLPRVLSYDRQKLLIDWNNTGREYPKKCIHELFQRRVQENPDAIAAVIAGESISYGLLNEKSNKLANFLLEQGVQPDFLIGICIEQSFNMLIGLLGVLKAGAAYLPLDPEMPPTRLHLLLADSSATLILTQKNFEQKFSVSDNEQLICLDDPDFIVSLESFDSKNIDSHSIPLTLSNLAYVIYTSGSTGNPKGVLVEHKGVVRLVQNTNYIGLDSSSVIGQASNIAFDAATFEIWGALLNGGKIVFVDKKTLINPLALNKLINSDGINTMFMTTALFNLIAAEFPHCFNGLKNLFFGGEAVSVSSVMRVLEQKNIDRLVHVYGPTECTTFSTWHDVHETDIENFGTFPIGASIANSTAYIFNQDMVLLPIGVPGELYLGGDGLARGYLNSPALTLEKFIENPLDSSQRLYRTGDIAKWLPNGSLEFVGRIDHQIKIRGFRVELGEIEGCISAHSDIKECIVIATSNPIGDKRVIAYLVPYDMPSADASVGFIDDLRSNLKSFLPDYMIPSAFMLLSNFELTPNGKIDRKRLPKVDISNEDGENSTAYENDMHKYLYEIWKDVVGVENIGINDNFFDIGGNSLSAVRVYKKIINNFNYKVSIIDLFTYPTIASLAAYIGGLSDSMPYDLTNIVEPNVNTFGQSVAIIGMAGRFPDANNSETFWKNIEKGVESIEFYSDEDLLAAGISPVIFKQKNYVNSGFVLKGIDQFDAEYFKFTPREAEITDPQQRMLLECAVETMESAGYVSSSSNTGVFVGTSNPRYLAKHLLANENLVAEIGEMRLLTANDQCTTATKISYKLNLTGPSLNILTACSTSLVAVHQACQSLLNNECEMALAGGASLMRLQAEGYLYEESGIMSPDGHCYAFDSRAMGTRSGSGAGLVLLKCLDKALQDGDVIHAVIKGSAINNDGNDKVGYTAPSVNGQAEVVRAALKKANVDASTIGYIETHGTGTTLGDPIEISALTKAFNYQPGQERKCVIGSIKPNIGHLDVAAGIVGLIKVIESLKNKKIPPTINYINNNPEINFSQSPFFVNTQLIDWQENQAPRRAGVSSFGIGGTNAHVIVEEAPDACESKYARNNHLFILSAKTQSALVTMTTNLAAHLEQAENVNLGDVAYTLQVGRAHYQYRSYFVAANKNEAIDNLKNNHANKNVVGAGTPIVFMYPGQGAQYSYMAVGLYQNELVFKKIVDECADYLLPLLDVDIRAILGFYDDVDTPAAFLNETSVAQPVLFVIEYALTRLLQSYGINPDVMIGHSLGEYVAACVAGVFTLNDALLLVSTRGRLMQRAPVGKMLSVALDKSTLQPLLELHGCCLAAVNAHDRCVASGSPDAILALQSSLMAIDISSDFLPVSHAYHSSLMDGVLDEFKDALNGIHIQAPQIPFISNLSGAMITVEDVTNPEYWINHLRRTVNFSAGINRLLSQSGSICIEIGPGNVLCSLVRRAKKDTDIVAIAAMRSAAADISDDVYFLNTIGKLWSMGVGVDVKKLHENSRGKRIVLPTYPFERNKYWIDSISRTVSSEVSNKNLTIEDEKQGFQVSTYDDNKHVVDSNADKSVNSIEEQILAIWKSLLGKKNIHIQDNFFELGGDSLLATRFLTIFRSENRFGGIEYPLSRFFTSPCVQTIAANVQIHLDQTFNKNMTDVAESKIIEEGYL